MQDTMTTTAGELHLQRFPVRKNETLQAWDNADWLLLEELVTQAEMQLSEQRVLVVNDPFAGLVCGLQQCGVPADKLTLWSDSYLSSLAMAHNCGLNGLAPAEFVDAVQTPIGKFDLIIMRLPKSNSLLRDQVARLLPHLVAGAKVIIPVMVKHLDKSLYELLERLLGPLTTSLARKKARLVFAQPAASAGEVMPNTNSWQYKNFSLQHYSGVYGRKRLDEGSQFLLQNWPQGDFQQVVDLGCGNGILSLQAARSWPAAQVIGVDESYMAVASARLNSETNGVSGQCQFQVGNCLTGLADDSADLVLCNPPFHQQKVVGDHIAMAMFKDAARVLQQQGELWVVGNRHLGYHAKLKRWFKRIEQQGKHSKFVVLRCRF